MKGVFLGTRMRLATLPTQPTQNESSRLVRTVFKRAELLDSSVLAVEHSTYFPSGRSPIHAESDSEEIIYFRRGRGRVLQGDKFVEVGPGSAVAIPGGIEHYVENTGTDTLEHILISVTLDGTVPAASAISNDGAIVPHGGDGLQRLACHQYRVAPGESTPYFDYSDRETVYAISSGFLVAHVKLPETEYEWQYSVDSSNCLWLPPERPHRFRNVGDCDAVITVFLCLNGN